MVSHNLIVDIINFNLAIKRFILSAIVHDYNVLKPSEPTAACGNTIICIKIPSLNSRNKKWLVK